MTISASDIIVDDVQKGFEEVIELIGKSVTYSRFKALTGDPSGYTKTWWEQDLSFNAIVSPVSSYATRDSQLEMGDRKLVFKQSEFTDQGSGDEAVPHSGDEVVIDGDTWTTEIGDDVIWTEEASGTLFEIYVRKAT